MRMFLALALSLLALPAMAEEWSAYGNARYGYSLPIPPGFVGSGESGNGDGQVFTSSKQNEILTVWAGYSGGTGFGMDALAAGTALEDSAWHVGTQIIHPQNAQFSAIQGIRALRQHMVMLCDGDTVAYVRLDYPMPASAGMERVFKRLVRGFDRGDC